MNEREIFVTALAASNANERESFLNDACQEDAPLRERIEALLQAERQLGSFIESSPVGSSGFVEDLGATADIPATSVKTGAMIGPYKIIKPLGEGGFGIVFMAEQRAPVRRKVAIKVIKPGMDTKEVIGRFEAERQALAVMDHPHIAKVLDCGATEAGAPYFVMELVSGLPITDYCDQHLLTTADRLALFSLVCQGVQHAHQKGIIHRDIKPSNILVTKTDGVATPKIIDFGISKAITAGLSDRTSFTEYGRMLGTPLYMSPEQASLTGKDVDTRSDVYSLGVVLYELLTGATPFDKSQIKHVACEEFRRMIRDDDPLKPSTRVSTLGETSASVTAHRRTDRQRLSALLRHDLDWIVMKALDKDCDRRYASASSLAEDIQRHLHHQPVEACPPSPLYRFTKFARRHRRTLVTVAALALMMVVGTGVSVWQSIRATRSERIAREEAAVSEAVISFINRDLLGRSDPDREPNRELKVREALDRAAKKIDGRFVGQPLVEAAIRHAVGTSYLSLGEYAEAEQHLSKAVVVQRQQRGAEHVKTLDSEEHLAIAVCGQGHAAKAEALHRKVLAIQLRLLGEDDSRTLATRMNLIASIFDQGRYDEAHRETKRLLASLHRALGPEHSTTLRCMGNLGNMERVIGNFEEAEKVCRKLLEIQTRVLRPEHPDILSNLSVLANTASSQGRYGDAIRLHQQVFDSRHKVLGAEHPSTLSSMNNLAIALFKDGQIDDAEQLRRDLLEVQRRVHGDEHPATLNGLMNLANIMMARAQLDDAERLHAKVLEVRRRVLGREHPKTLASELNFFNVINAKRRYKEAERGYRRLLEIQARVSGKEHANTLAVRTNLSIAIHKQGKSRLPEAEEVRREILAIQSRVLGPEHPDTLATLLNLANTVRAQGEKAEAEQLYREVLPKMQRVLGDEHPFTLKCMMAMSVAIEENHPVEAEGLYRQALAGQRRRLGDAHPDTVHNLNALAWFLAFSAPQSQRAPAEAVRLASEAVQRNPDNRRYLQTLGQAQYRHKQWDAAKTSLQQSLQQRGFNYHDVLTLALVQCQLGEQVEAAKLYEIIRSREMKQPCHIQLREELEILLGRS